MSENNRYNTFSIMLHWLVAISIIGMFFFGLYIDEMTSNETKKELIGLHKSIGMTVILLTMLRLAARLAFKAPALPDNMTSVEKLIAKAIHILLYVFSLSIPLSGWVMSNAAGYPVVPFGILEAPVLVEKDQALREIASEAHEIMAFTIIVIAGFHALAALKHHYLQKDGLLNRMRPW